MGKKSTKENKTKYHLAREELGWSREYASEQLGMITPERLERIESEKVTPDPKEILAMAETYHSFYMLAYADQGNSYRQTAHIQMFAVLGLPALLLDKCETCKRAPRKSPPGKRFVKGGLD